MEKEPEEIIASDYDVIVVGAGPSGCEAALAAARAGAQTLCLSINLDMVGYPTATPVLVDDSDDRRHALLAELDGFGAELPGLLHTDGISGRDGVAGRVLVDRRRLGLAWKEQLESEEGLALRQALVTSLIPGKSGWKLETKLREHFTARAVVVAAGTFLNGRVIDAGETSPGGRWAEIPANYLAKCLQMQDIKLVDIWARTSPRLSSRGIDEKLLGDPRLRRDGEQLGEVLAFTLETDGNRTGQLQALRQNKGLTQAWITRPSYSILHLGLAAEQAGKNLEVIGKPGLFFAGRAAGSCNYTEAAALGFIAGINAAHRAGHGAASQPLSFSNTLVSRLLDRVAHKYIRPVTVRIDDESGC